MDIVWDGVTRGETPSDYDLRSRLALADASRAYDWDGVFAVLAEHPQLVNSSRPDGTSWYAPLHQAAHANAPTIVVQRLIDLGAWRSHRNRDGERPRDVARRMGHHQLAELLEPAFRTNVAAEVMTAIQTGFHATIGAWAGRVIDEHAIRLPELEVLLELDEPKMWFPIPKMYGGFAYRLVRRTEKAALLSENWSRMGGDYQRHEITADGVVLIEQR